MTGRPYTVAEWEYVADVLATVEAEMAWSARRARRRQQLRALCRWLSPLPVAAITHPGSDR